MNTKNNHNRLKPARKSVSRNIFNRALAAVVLLVAMTANTSAFSANQAELTYIERAAMAWEEQVEKAEYTEKIPPDLYVNRSAYFELPESEESGENTKTDEITVSVGGKILSDVRIDRGTAYVSVREFFETSAPEETVIVWNSAELCAEITTPRLSVALKQDSNYILSNGRAFYSESKTYVENGKMYAPVRLLASASASSVEWDSEKREVTVTAGNGILESGDTFYNQEDLSWLSRIIHAESRGEPFEGKVAVGCVIMNRVQSESFPNSIYDVIFDSKHGIQFTPAASGAVYNTPEPESVIAAKICLEGYTVSATIKYFINEKLATTTWVSTTRSHELSIGNHDFYS